MWTLPLSLFPPNQKQLMQELADCTRIQGDREWHFLAGPLCVSSCSGKHGHHQLLNFISYNHCSQRDSLDLFLSPREDSHGPIWITCLSLGQSIEAKGEEHMYCSHLHPTQSLLLFGVHITLIINWTHFLYLLCLLSVFLSCKFCKSKHTLTVHHCISPAPKQYFSA